MHNIIRSIIDFFYPPFIRLIPTPYKKLMPIRFFRYLSCGGLNVVFDWILFAVFYNFIFQKQILDLHFISITPHIAAFVFTFPITSLSGFYLSRNITFSGSYLKGRVQLFRYFLVVAGCVVINYVCLKLFVDILHLYPTPSKMITTIFTTIFSYLTQKNFTFKQIKQI